MHNNEFHLTIRADVPNMRLFIRYRDTNKFRLFHIESTRSTDLSSSIYIKMCGKMQFHERTKIKELLSG